MSTEMYMDEILKKSSFIYLYSYILRDAMGTIPQSLCIHRMIECDPFPTVELPHYAKIFIPLLKILQKKNKNFKYSKC